MHRGKTLKVHLAGQLLNVATPLALVVHESIVNLTYRLDGQHGLEPVLDVDEQLLVRWIAHTERVHQASGEVVLVLDGRGEGERKRLEIGSASTSEEDVGIIILIVLQGGILTACTTNVKWQRIHQS